MASRSGVHTGLDLQGLGVARGIRAQGLRVEVLRLGLRILDFGTRIKGFLKQAISLDTRGI